MPQSLPRELILDFIQKASRVLQTSCLSSLREKLSSDKTITQLFALLIESLISQIQILQSKEYTSTKTNNGSEYEVLEESIQKSEQEIRKHIRIQQQMKLYTDSIEEKLELTEKKLVKQENLLDGLKFENRELKSRIRELERVKNREKEEKSKLGMYQFDQPSFYNLKKTIVIEKNHQKSEECQSSLNDNFQNQKIGMLKKRKSTKGSLRKKLYKDLDVYRTLDYHNESEPNSQNHSRAKKRVDHSGSILRREARCNSVCK